MTEKLTLKVEIPLFWGFVHPSDFPKSGGDPVYSIQGVDTDHFRGIINAGCTESSVRISADSGAPSEYRVLPISQRFDIQMKIVTV